MKKVIIWLVVIVVVIWGIISWGSKKTAIMNAPIKVGVIAPFAGALSAYGEQVRKGVESVQVPANIQFVFEDDGCDAKTAVSAFNKLISIDEVNYVIGPACGSPQEAIVSLLKNSSKIVVVPSAASRTLYEQSGGNFYDIQYALEDEAAFLADQMFARGYKKIALISYQNQFSKIEADSFKSHFKGEIVKEISYAGDASDISSELAKIKSGGYDAIFSTDISFYFANGLKKLRNLGITVPVFSPYPVELPAVRPLVDGVYYSFPADINDGQGGIRGLSKQAADLIVRALGSCGDNYSCVKKFIDKDGFDKTGTKQRVLIIKQIKGNEVVEVK